MAEEPAGWLSRVVGRLGGRSARKPGPSVRLGAERADSGDHPGVLPMPYRLRHDFLSVPQAAFYRVLRTAIAGQWVICPKVRLADVFFVTRKMDAGFRTRLDSRAVDFLLCHPETLQPALGVVLDAPPRRRTDTLADEAFLDDVFWAAGLPLLRVPRQETYVVPEVAALIKQALAAPEPAAKRPSGTPPAAEPNPQRMLPFAHPPIAPPGGPVAPLCPRCGIPMVLRVGQRSDGSRETFYGCVNYPHCRQMLPAPRP